MAIRRPNKVPTSGAEVYNAIAVNASAGTQQTTAFPIDLQLFKNRTTSDSIYAIDRYRGVSTTTTETSTKFLETNTTGAESDSSSLSRNWNNTGFAVSSSFASLNMVYWNFRRAKGFFDIVCKSNSLYLCKFAELC